MVSVRWWRWARAIWPSTRPSTPTAVSPTARSWAQRTSSTAPPSWPAPTPGSPSAASPSSASSPTAGTGYKSNAWAKLCTELGVTHTRIRPYRPQTNGKVERFNRTLADEWAYVRAYRSEAERCGRFDRWLHDYNHHRGHTALGGLAPIEIVNNQPGHHT
jgi:hypothetical protein